MVLVCSSPTGLTRAIYRKLCLCVHVPYETESSHDSKLSRQQEVLRHVVRHARTIAALGELALQMSLLATRQATVSKDNAAFTAK
jgi:hypothetical protein